MSKLLFRMEAIKEDRNFPDAFRVGFYRTTDCQGVTPYAVIASKGLWREDGRHPLPEDDCKLKDFWYSLGNDQWKYYFGFSNFDSLKRWFYNDKALQLVTHIVCVGVYLVEEYHEGYTQTICNRDKVIKRIAQFEADVKGEVVKTALESLAIDL